MSLTLTKEIRSKFQYNVNRLKKPNTKNKKIEVISIADDENGHTEDITMTDANNVQSLDSLFDNLHSACKKNKKLPSFSFSNTPFFFMRTIFHSFSFNDFITERSFEDRLVSSSKEEYKLFFNANIRLINLFLKEAEEHLVPKYICSLNYTENLFCFSYSISKTKRRFVLMNKDNFINIERKVVLTIKDERNKEIDYVTINEDIRKKFDDIINEVRREGYRKK